MAAKRLADLTREVLEDIKRRRKEARLAFIDERSVGLPKDQRVDHPEDRADLDRWLLAAAEEPSEWIRAKPFDWAAVIDARAGEPLVARELETLWRDVRRRLRALGVEAPEERPTMDAIFDLRADVVDEALVHRVEIACLWPVLYRRWRDDARTRARRLYRFPTSLSGPHKAIGGKRHGKDRGLPIKAEASGDHVRIVIEAPSNAQLELGTTGRATTKADDFDESGKLRVDAIMRMIREVTGPQVSMIGHAAFALAQLHAEQDGRAADGRFWFSPTELADVLGYSRIGNGEGRAKRIPADVTKKLRESFTTYANTLVRQTGRFGGSEIRISGTLLYPTRKEATPIRPSGKVGREKKQEWRIRDELWKMARAHFIHIPIALLDAGAERPDVWAHCIRVYEVIACHARVNAKHLVEGSPLPPMSLEWLSRESNVFGPGRRERDAHEDLVGYLRRLEKREAITGLECVTLADGRPGVRLSLPQDRMTELREIGARHRALKGKRQ